MEYHSTHRRKTGRFTGGLLLLAVGAAGAFFYFRPASPNWDPAAVIPQNTAVVMSIDISSTSQKKQALAVVQEISEDSGLNPHLEDILKQFKSKTGLDLKEDILPLTNMRGAAALLDKSDAGEVAFISAIGAKDERAAEELSNKIAQAVAKTAGSSIKQMKISGKSFRRIELKSGNVFIGTISQAVVMADGAETVKRSIEAASSPAKSIISSTGYQKASVWTPSTVACLYVSGDGVRAVSDDTVPIPSINGFSGNFKSAWGQLKADGRGIVIDGACETASGSDIDPGRFAAGDLKELEEMAPADAGVFIGLGGWGSVWEQAKNALEDHPQGKFALDQFASSAKAAIGIDPVKEFVEQSRALALIFVPREPQGMIAVPGEIVLAVKPDDPARMEKNLKKARTAMAKYLHTSVASSKVGDSEVFYTVTGFPGLPQWSDATINDVVLVSHDKGALEGIIKRDKERKPALTEDACFKQAGKLLPGDVNACMYINMRPIYAAMEQSIPDQSRDKVKKTMQRVGAIAVGASQAGKNTTRVVTAIPFL